MIPEIKVHKKVLSDIVGMKQYLVKRRDVLIDYYMKFSIIDTVITPDFNIGLRASPKRFADYTKVPYSKLPYYMSIFGFYSTPIRFPKVLAYWHNIQQIERHLASLGHFIF
jgi:hypothetical protein